MRFIARTQITSALALVLLTWVSVGDSIADPRAENRPAVDESVSMPDLFYETEDGSYAWVSAERAEGLENEHEMRVRVRMADRVAGALSSTDGSCSPAIDVVRVSSERSNLTSALDHVPHIALARVTGREEGFFFGIPSTLFRVETEEVFKGSAGLGGVHFFSLPVADFPTAEGRICRTSSGFAELPDPGDRVLLLSDGGSSTHGYLRIAGDSGMISIPRDGPVSLPRQYQSERGVWPKAPDGFLDRVRETLGARR